MEKFIVANGVAFRIFDSGAPGAESGSEGPVVLFLHGYLENLNVWDEVVSVLRAAAPGVRVVALDLPGHGISEVRGPEHSMEFLADTVYEALVEVGVAKCCVIGHSMGGYVALALAERHPSVVAGLVLFSSTPNADSAEKREDRAREIAIVEAGKKELLARTLPGRGFAAGNRKRFADEIEDLAELVQLTEDEGIVALLRGMAARPDRGAVLRGLAASGVPVMLLLGRHDEYITEEVAEAMIAAQPGARVVWLERSGHNGMIEQPREAVEAILQLMDDNKLKDNTL